MTSAILSIDPGSTANTFRRKRFAHIIRLIDAVIAEKGSCHILDVGGEVRYWGAVGDLLQERNVKIDLINLTAEPVNDPMFRSFAGSGCDMTQFADESYDLVHSNSVIEHVGNWQNMKAFAKEVRRIAPRYYVQAPYFWFPIEPHFRAPFFHWLPESWRAKILYRFKLGFSEKPGNYDDAMLDTQDAHLPDGAQMKHLFPDAEHVPERFLGVFVKSLMAIKG